ncbi:MAG: oligosaccharide flippase family protein [Pseudomonadales bacterium]|nr:oligosaccharide flippase family protein [Pseudomonadales bacterium]
MSAFLQILEQFFSPVSRWRMALGILIRQWLATTYVAGVSMLLIFFLGRMLGPENFGIYSFVLSAVSIYAIVLDGGYRTLIFREGVSQSGGLSLHADQLLASAIGNVLIFTVAGILSILLWQQEFRWVVIAAILCFSLITVTVFLSCRLKAEGRFPEEAAWQIVVRTLTALSVFVAVYFLHGSILHIYIAWSLGLLMALALPMARALRVRPSLNLNYGVLKSCLAFVTIDAATILYFRSDIVMLGLLGAGNTVVGQYSAASKILEGIVLMMTPVAHLAFRSLRLHWQQKEEFNRLYKLLMLLVLPVSALIAVAGLFFANDIILFAFGGQYSDAGELLFWLLMAVFFILPNYIATQAVIALNLERYYAIAATLAAVFNIATNYVLIPLHGALGAAWATIATEGFLLVFLVLVIAGNGTRGMKKTVTE